MNADNFSVESATFEQIVLTESYVVFLLVLFSIMKPVGTLWHMPSHSGNGSVFPRDVPECKLGVIFFFRSTLYTRPFLLFHSMSHACPFQFFDIACTWILAELIWRGYWKDHARHFFFLVTDPSTYNALIYVLPLPARQSRQFSLKACLQILLFPGIGDWSFRPFNTIVPLSIKSPAVRHIA